MKKLSIVLSAALTVLALTNCATNIDENITPEGGTNKISFKADIAQTRTTLDASTYQVAWENGDVIYLTTEESAGSTQQEFYL